MIDWYNALPPGFYITRHSTKDLPPIAECLTEAYEAAKLIGDEQTATDIMAWMLGGSDK